MTVDALADGGGARPRLPPGHVILCADDFAISDGVSRGIEQLAEARRLSCTSALVTLPGWAQHAERLVHLRPKLAIGLHINLTLGAPVGPMLHLAPLGRLPALGDVLRRALTRNIDVGEIATEVDRQLTRFEASTGFAPDFVDGHQHVHTLPGVRTGVLKALSARYPRGMANGRQLLIRDPGDAAGAIVRRGAATAKALFIAGLSRGFANRATALGFATNRGFSGVSRFDLKSPFAGELARFFAAPGPRHLVMCHPGYPDAELAALDPHTERRRQELDALLAVDGLPEAIWHVDRKRGADHGLWPSNEAGARL